MTNISELISQIGLLTQEIASWKYVKPVTTCYIYIHTTTYTAVYEILLMQSYSEFNYINRSI